MNRLKGKYYWVRTPAGKEVAFKRNSGKWELCGINNDEDCKNAILKVYGEVANGVNASDSDLHLQRVSNNKVAVCDCEKCKPFINFPIFTTHRKQQELLKQRFDMGKCLGIEEGFRMCSKMIDNATISVSKEKYKKLQEYLINNNMQILFRSILEEKDYPEYGLIIKEMGP